ncbi:MAG: HupE/UreJ family protein [Pseudomonadales bacterium]
MGLVTLCGAMLVAAYARGHGVEAGDASFLQNQQGFHFWAYFYLGAKHMVTGYDHLLFLAGVIFFLFRLSEIATYVTLFAIGHSLTLILGVWFDIPANPYLIDAVIGFSIVYKAFENLGGFKHLGVTPNTKVAVWVFGLFHGFGLATKLQALNISADGLLANLLAFNLGVEAGQLLSLLVIVTLVNIWRGAATFRTQALVANGALMSAGFVFVFYQLTGYYLY